MESEVARLSAERQAYLRARARAVSAVRSFFDARGFLEVSTPLLVRAPGLDAHIEAVPAGAGHHLITSPEFQMKRLLCAGLARIYTVCKVFRAGEEGAHHASEFTMLEWYRADARLEEVLDDTRELVRHVVRAVRGHTRVTMTDQAREHGPGPGPGKDADAPERTVDVGRPWQRMTVAQAMERFAGVSMRGDEDAAELARRVRAAGVDLGRATAWDDVFYTAFVERVEPAIARMDVPLILEDWPIPLAALARAKPGDEPVVERFEVYIAGLELCNAFGELTDPVEQRARFEAENRAREARSRAPYPLDERFLAALEAGMPESAGIALGIDRLIMLATGARRIRDVLTFAWDEL